MGHLITCTRMGEKGVFEVIWSFLNRENVIFYCYFGIEWQGPVLQEEQGPLLRTKRSGGSYDCHLEMWSRDWLQQQDFHFCVSCRDIWSPLPSSHVVSSKIKASQCSMHSVVYHTVRLKIRHRRFVNYTDVGWCNSVQRAICTSCKELLCNSNILPFLLCLLALRTYSNSYLWISRNMFV